MQAEGLLDLPIYRHLEKSDHGVLAISLLLVAGSVFFHGLVILLAGIRNEVLLVVVLFHSIVAGLYLTIPVVSLRLTQLHVEDYLDSQQRVLLVAREVLRGNLMLYGVFMLVACTITMHLYSEVIYQIDGFHLFSTVSFKQDLAYTAFMYLIVPLQGLAAGVALCSIAVVIRYLWQVAGEVTIDVYQLEDYSCVSSVMVLTFLFFSALLSVVGITYLFPSKEIELAFGWMASRVAGVGVLFILFTSLPVVRLRNRIDPILAQQTREVRNSAVGGVNADAIVQLMYLESRSSWPIGARLRRLIMVGIVPPLAWVLAALVENTIYS